MIEILALYYPAKGTPLWFIFVQLSLFLFALGLPVLIRFVVLRRSTIRLWLALCLAFFFGLFLSIFAQLVLMTLGFVIPVNLQPFFWLLCSVYTYWIMHIGYKDYCIKRSVEAAMKRKGDK